MNDAVGASAAGILLGTALLIGVGVCGVVAWVAVGRLRRAVGDLASMMASVAAISFSLAAASVFLTFALAALNVDPPDPLLFAIAPLFLLGCLLSIGSIVVRAVERRPKKGP